MLGGLGLLGTASLASPLLAQIAPAGRQLEAFCIGLDAYQNLSPLQRAGADADAVAQQLDSVGYRTLFGRDTTLDTFYDHLFEFYGRLSPDSAAFVFIAGHGVQIDGRNYLLPVDSPALTSMDALSHAVVLDDLLLGIAGNSPAQTIVILDACRNNVSPATLPGQSSGLASTNAPGGQFIAYSAGAGEYALDRLGQQDCSSLGLFTRHFVDEIRHGALIYDAIANTRAKVIPDAREIGHSQHPAIYDQSAFPFRVDGDTAGSAASTATPVGDLRGTGIVIAASHDYSCVGKELTSPRYDADRVAQFFTACGAEVALLREPDKTTVLEACSAMRTRGHRQLGYYFLGLGGCDRDQAMCFLPKPACGDYDLPDVSEFAAADFTQLEHWFEVVSHADIIEAFGMSQSGAATGEEPEMLALFYDACLTVDLLSDRLAGIAHSRENGMAELERTQRVALLAASSVFQRAIDLVEGTTSSPFTIAMLNALAVPGLTMAEMAERVRGEVEVLTEREQTPRLFGDAALRDRVFVAPRELQPTSSCDPT